MNKDYIVKKYNLLQLEEELNNPELSALTKDGWVISEVIPVVDNGEACLILILNKRLSEITINPLNRLELFQCIVLVFIAIAICALYIL